MARQKRYRAFNFDLDSAQMSAVFGANGRQRGYGAIKKYLEGNGFEHRQKSGYVSLKTLTILEVQDLLEDMDNALPWMGSCVQRFDVTDINSHTDMAHMFSGGQSPGTEAEDSKEPKAGLVRSDEPDPQAARRTAAHGRMEESERDL
jgi:virulence-associated protein VapD